MHDKGCGGAEESVWVSFTNSLIYNPHFRYKMDKTSSLEELTTGTKIKVQQQEKQIYIPFGDNFENPKKPEITNWRSEIRDYSFCWMDNYKGTDLIVLGSLNPRTNPGYETYHGCVYPSRWILQENEIFVAELPDFKYQDRLLRDGKMHISGFEGHYNIFEDGTEGWLARRLAGAIDGKSPSGEEIVQFRNSKPYFDIFGTTPVTEMMRKYHEKRQ
jgi:hypothetical protein